MSIDYDDEISFLSKYTHCIAPLYFVICSALLLGKSIAFVHQKKLFSSTDTLPNGSLSLWNSLEFQTNSIAQKCVGKKNKKSVWRCPNLNWPFKKSGQNGCPGWPPPTLNLYSNNILEILALRQNGFSFVKFAKDNSRLWWRKSMAQCIWQVNPHLENTKVALSWVALQHNAMCRNICKEKIIWSETLNLFTVSR